MWTLSQLRQQLTYRLAETSGVFWEPAERDAYLNEAQRFVAAITRGVPSQIMGEVTSAVPYLLLPDKFVEEGSAGVYVERGNALTTIPRRMLDIIDPGWRNLYGTPRWALFDTQSDQLRIIPIPNKRIHVVGNITVLPDDMEQGSDPAFNGEAAMEKYLSPMVTLAAAYAILKERYGEDVNLFYGIFREEMMALGVKPDEVPTTMGGGQ